jgi:hypothetical protein
VQVLDLHDVVIEVLDHEDAIVACMSKGVREEDEHGAGGSDKACVHVVPW